MIFGIKNVVETKLENRKYFIPNFLYSHSKCFTNYKYILTLNFTTPPK